MITRQGLGERRPMVAVMPSDDLLQDGVWSPLLRIIVSAMDTNTTHASPPAE
jgi:hypothetical protein